MNQGVGKLIIGRPSDGLPLAMWLIPEGSTLVNDGLGREFTFTLERAPMPSEFDIREMSSLDISNYLSRRLAEEQLAEDERLTEEHWSD